MLSSGEYGSVSAELETMSSWALLSTQFFCCECSKVLRVLRRPDVRYPRGLWTAQERKLNAELKALRQPDHMDDAHDDLDESMIDDLDYLEEV